MTMGRIVKNNQDLQKVNELHSLTDTALFYAQRNDIEQVRKIIEKRKRILEEFKKCIYNSRNKAVLKKMIMSLLKKDCHIDEKLRLYKGSLEDQKMRYVKKIRLRRRFVKRKFGAPRFIDRKA